jgi:hypothetical protein
VGTGIPDAERTKLLAPAIEEWIAADHETAWLQSAQISEGRFQLTIRARMQDGQIQPQWLRRCLQVFRYRCGTAEIGGIDEHGKR